MLEAWLGRAAGAGAGAGAGAEVPRVLCSVPQAAAGVAMVTLVGLVSALPRFWEYRAVWEADADAGGGGGGGGGNATDGGHGGGRQRQQQHDHHYHLVARRTAAAATAEYDALYLWYSLVCHFFAL